MLTLTSSTAATVAMHASDGAWIMFVQVVSPGNPYGPIKIEAVSGEEFSDRLVQLARCSAFELRLIGLMQGVSIDDVHTMFATYCLHDDWFTAGNELVAFIAQNAQDAIAVLAAQTHPGALPEKPVGIEDLAAILGVSVSTVRRMVKENRIPFLKFGRIYKFVVADVIASLEHR